MATQATNRLTVKLLDAIKYDGKARKIFDGGGLYLLVNASGKYWRLKYRYAGRERAPLALGVYPEVSLADARKKRDAARKALSEGADPGEIRRQEKVGKRITAGNTVEFVAREWMQRVQKHNVGTEHWATCMQRLEDHLFAHIGHRPIAAVTPLELLDVLNKQVALGHIETAHRVKMLCGQIWRYGIPTGRTERDIAADLREALPGVTTEHFPAITEPGRFGKLLLCIDRYIGKPEATAAFKLSPLLFVRPGELRHMEWAAIDLQAATWDYKPSKRRRGEGGGEMVFPLARQVVAILADLQPITGHRKYVFAWRDRPMSENTINAALTRIGFDEEQSAHGFRASARTMLDERLHFPPQVIEMQLAHNVKDPNGRAYNRTTYLPQRTEMMQRWADYCDELKAAARKKS